MKRRLGLLVRADPATERSRTTRSPRRSPRRAVAATRSGTHSRGRDLFVANGSRVDAFDVGCGTGGETCGPLRTWTAPSGITSAPATAGGQVLVTTTAGKVFTSTLDGAS